MALLLVIALLSAAGTLVDSASKITDCDRMPDSATCYQYACDQPPCSILCGQSSSFDRCVQTCNGSTCNTMVCSSSVQNCQQNCPSGNCTDYKCDAKLCFQNCQGDNDYCKTMRCTNSNPGTTCEQSDGKEMFCDSERCDQNCAKKCKMTCSSSVKECKQSCLSGDCTYKCDAERCDLNCPGGNCSKIEAPTKPPTGTGTKIKSPTKPPTGTGTRLQLVISLVPGLMLAMVVFM